MWPFELIEQIGEGGMGVVYRARYVVNGREVALKMLPRDVTDETTLARFERELDVLKNLKHPNIVRCFGGSCENSRRFYAMELVHGGTLEDKLEDRKRLPWEQVIFYGLQMCDALECSHAKGVIHRDVKPSNFLLTKAGQLKLSDFGLASVAASRKITVAGKTAGTFLYMAPEQIHGKEVTPQTDLYALGCVLYELVTGEPPFVGSTPAATLHMHCRDTPVRPTEKVLDCPVEFERIILSLLEKKEQDRPESATEVGRRLRAVKQTIKVVIPERESRLKKLILPLGLAQDSSGTQDSIASTFSQLNALSRKIVIALSLALICSLIWNLFEIVQNRSISQAEQLWIEACAAENLEVRKHAILSLAKVSEKSGKHLDVLKAGLIDPKTEIREVSVVAIESVGGRAKSLVPTLLGVTKLDSDQDVRDLARQAAKNIQGTRVKYSFPWAGSLWALILIVATGLGIHHWSKTSEYSVPSQ